MRETEATGRIKIHRIPDGEFPVEVRAQWPKIPELKCLPICGSSPEPELGALTGEEMAVKTYGFHVPQDLAIEALREVNPKAARYLIDRGFPQQGKYFCFGMTEATILSGVRYQETFVFTDEMRGQRFR